MIYISKELYLYISNLKKKKEKELKTATGKLYVQTVQKCWRGGCWVSLRGNEEGNYIGAQLHSRQRLWGLKNNGNKVTYEINYIKKLNFHFF